MSSATPTPIHQRRDAERNHEAIVTAAIAVLADAPDATMAEIATASGTGRSTLYRHFPDRAALVEAISLRVRVEAEDLVKAGLKAATVEDAVPVLAAIADTLAGLGDRYRFLLQQDEQRMAKAAGQPGLAGRKGPPNIVLDFIVGAQQAGTVRTDLDADWLMLAYVHILIAAVKAQFPDPATQRDSIEKTVRSLVSPS